MKRFSKEMKVNEGIDSCIMGPNPTFFVFYAAKTIYKLLTDTTIRPME